MLKGEIALKESFSYNSYEYIERDSVQRIFSYTESEYLNSGRRKKFFTQTFGCQQNVSDTEKIDGMLIQMGFEPTDDKDDADKDSMGRIVEGMFKEDEMTKRIVRKILLAKDQRVQIANRRRELAAAKTLENDNDISR